MKRAEILGDVIDKLGGLSGDGIPIHRVFTLAGAIGPYLAQLTRDRHGGIYYKLVFEEDGSEYITTPDGGPDLPEVPDTEAERAANIVVRNPVMLSQALFETAALNGELPVYSQPPDKPDQHKFHGYAPANTPENEVAAKFLASNWQSTLIEAKVRTINGIRQWRLVVVDWKDPN